MSNLATKPKPRAHKLVAETFEVFDISEVFSGQARSMGKFDTFNDALEEIGYKSHKSKLFIKRTNTLSGEVTLHFYIVRKKSQGEKRYSNYQTRVVHDLYPEHLFDLKVEGVL